MKLNFHPYRVKSKLNTGLVEKLTEVCVRISDEHAVSHKEGIHFLLSEDKGNKTLINVLRTKYNLTVCYWEWKNGVTDVAYGLDFVEDSNLTKFLLSDLSTYNSD